VGHIEKANLTDTTVRKIYVDAGDSRTVFDISIGSGTHQLINKGISRFVTGAARGVDIRANHAVLLNERRYIVERLLSSCQIDSTMRIQLAHILTITLQDWKRQ
jgi:hypothetical protein